MIKNKKTDAPKNPSTSAMKNTHNLWKLSLPWIKSMHFFTGS
jgi:hypothetical protein